MSTTLIKVPVLGESVTEAIVSRWYKKIGDPIREGDVILELETDKITLEVNAPASGKLEQIYAPEGKTVAIGETLASIMVGDVQSSGDTAPENLVTDKSASIPSPLPSQEEKNLTILANTLPQSGPATRKMLEELGMSPTDIQGTGKDGRITKDDIRTTQALPRPPMEPETIAPGLATLPHFLAAQSLTSQTREPLRKPMSLLRRKIAERLKYAQNTAAILTTFNECDMSTVMALRKTYQDIFVKKHGIKLGFMSFFVKACVEALKEIPAVNGEIEGDEMVFHNRYDIGVAVSVPQGLVVPVLRDADRLGLHAIEKAIAEFGEKAKANKFSMADLSGGTFTISNGGTFGSLVSTPILNPPQSGILGMHKIQERPVAIDGHVVIRPMMYIALSYDHRMIDGREAVTFLVKVKEMIEDPARMLLGLA